MLTLEVLRVTPAVNSELSQYTKSGFQIFSADIVVFGDLYKRRRGHGVRDIFREQNAHSSNAASLRDIFRIKNTKVALRIFGISRREEPIGFFTKPP
mmetsp:Transcript_67478/g.126201  ORF Transcript_67478/g.126201 Transcript_67478/m.126201 type:complete len:97 (+) Transcript_67478:55-345(+)